MNYTTQNFLLQNYFLSETFLFFCFARFQMSIIKLKLFLDQLTIFLMKSSTLAQYKNFEPVFIQMDGLEPDLLNLEDLDKI